MTPGDTTPAHGTTAALARALAIGAAAGSRSSLGVAAPVLARRAGDRPGAGPAWRRRLVRAVACAAVVGELVGDKLPTTPSRLDPPGAYVRLASGAVGGVLVARRRTRGLGVVAAAAAGAAGAAVGTWGGAAWRRLAVGERPDWPGAVAEDAVALTLAAWAVRR